MSLAVCTGFGAQQAPQEELQQFVVLRSETLIAPFDSLTNEQAHCSISGSGNFATMRCQAPAGRAQASYHYITTLVVDQQGMAYIIACHESLIDLWCKKLSPGIAVEGSFESGQKFLSVADGSRSHRYQTLTSAMVGPLSAGAPIPSGNREKVRTVPAKPATAAAPPAAVAPSAPAAPAAREAAPPNAGNAGPMASNKSTTEDEARVSFVCGQERPRQVPIRPKRFASRIRTSHSRNR